MSEQDYPFSVYALVDGAVFEESAHDNVEDAEQAWAELCQDYYADRPDADVTVHLYDSHAGHMLAERHIPASVHA